MFVHYYYKLLLLAARNVHVEFNHLVKRLLLSLIVLRTVRLMDVLFCGECRSV